MQTRRVYLEIDNVPIVKLFIWWQKQFLGTYTNGLAFVHTLVIELYVFQLLMLIIVSLTCVIVDLIICLIMLFISLFMNIFCTHVLFTNVY